MNSYFSSFITGLDEVVSEGLKSCLPESKITQLFDGLVIWKTNAPVERIKEIRFFNNSFLLLSQTKTTDLEPFVRQVLENEEITKRLTPFLPKTKASFRIMFSQENQPASVSPKLLADLEKKFIFRNLFVNRSNPEVELLFLIRSEGQGFLGLRLTRHKDYKKTLPAGELRPELAHLLCLISDPRPEDIFLDPFAGYGAIPVERASAFLYKQIFAGDIDIIRINDLKAKTKKFGRLIIGRWDATKLSAFQNGSIDKIVTDPPWAIHSKIDIKELYPKFLREAYRILKKCGVLVVLVADKELWENCLEKILGFKVEKKYTILVSGKKAAIYKIIKVES